MALVNLHFCLFWALSVSVRETLAPDSGLPEAFAVMLSFPIVQSNELERVAGRLEGPPLPSWNWAGGWYFQSGIIYEAEIDSWDSPFAFWHAKEMSAWNAWDNALSVQRMALQPEHPPVIFRPPFGNEFEIEIRIRPVNLVPNHRMAKMRQVHPQLVQSPRVRLQAQ